MLERRGCGCGHAPLVARDWLPDKEVLGTLEEEGTAVAAVEGLPGAAVGGGQGEGGGGGGNESGDSVVFQVVEKAQHGGCPVERAEAAEEVGVGDDAAPGLADEGGAEEGGGVVRREA